MTRAFRIDDLARQGPFSRTKLFNLIGRGLLPARKLGAITFVLEDDWRALLEGAPLATQARQKQNSSDAPSIAA